MVLDYVIGSEKMMEREERLEIEEATNSDHHAMIC